MTTYTLNPDVNQSFVEWSDPARWVGSVVPNSPDADVVIPNVTYTSGGAYSSSISIDPGQSYSINSARIVSNHLLLNGSLTVTGALSLSSGGEVDLKGGRLSIGALDNSGYDIQGSGEVTSQGSIVNTGLIVGNLVLSLHEFTNSGRVAGNATINNPAGGFTNFANGTLTGSTYESLDGGPLTFDVGGLIFSDPANLIIDDTYSRKSSIVSLDGQGNALTIQDTLRTIDAVGLASIGEHVLHNEHPKRERQAPRAVRVHFRGRKADYWRAGYHRGGRHNQRVYCQ